MKTGIFIDIDGTLTNDQKKISDFDKETIKHIANDPCYVVYLITGKSAHNAMPYYQELGLGSKLITSAGQVITNPKTNEAFKVIFTKQEVLELALSSLREKGILENYLIETNENKYYMHRVEKSNLAKIVANSKNLKPIKKDQMIKNIVGAYFQLKNMNEIDLETITKKINQLFPDIKTTYWHTDGNPHVLQVKPIHACKEAAMKYVVKIDKLDKTIAFGNGQTDILMLEQSDIGIAMKNSFEKIKESANITTEYDNNNSGVSKELVKLLKEQ